MAASSHELITYYALSTMIFFYKRLDHHFVILMTASSHKLSKSFKLII